jgi:hypothetical protein
MSKYRCMILERMDEGLLDPTPLVEALVNWLSEADAKEFYEMYFEEAEEGEE